MVFSVRDADSFWHLHINLEILKQVQDDALVGGYDNRNENDFMRDIHLT